MKAIKFKTLLLLVVFGLTITTSVKAQDDKVEKKYHKEYSVTANSKLYLENKYGDIDVRNWDKNQVVIDVVITVKHRDRERADKLLSFLDVKFSQEGDEIKAVTQIDSKFSKSNRSVFNNESKEFSIDYTVNMPTDMDIELRNKYGDAFINELSGLVNISVKYGYLKVNKLLRGNTKPFNKIYIGYSKAEVAEVNWLKLDMSYSRIEFETSKALMVMSKYSKLYINDSRSIVAESKYDTYNIGEVDNLVFSAAYGSLKTEQVNRTLQLEMKYTGCKVDYIPSGFEKIIIENRYGGIKLGIDSNASYKIDGNAEYAQIHIPSGSKLSRIEENTKLSINGLVGTDPNTSSVVKINTKYGSVHLDD
ncbi:MAG: hypothetical protein J7K53_13115 [Bacteroidales bacterium]|nr:hypothetical protein [Bacteroidales bacterium]